MLVLADPTDLPRPRQVPGGPARPGREHVAQRFHTCLIQGRKKATERRAMGQLLASEQGHERRRKRLQTLVIRRKCRFTADGIAHQHDHEVNHFKDAEAFAGKANLVGDFGKDTLTCQGVSNQGHFAKPGRHPGDWQGFGLNAYRERLIRVHRISYHFASLLG